jgi:hypothetical protein
VGGGDSAELNTAARALMKMSGITPRMGTKIHEGAAKTTYLIEGRDNLYVACRYGPGKDGRRLCSRAAAGVDAAAAAGLGPRPLHAGKSPVIRSENRWWTGYVFIDGPALWGDRSLRDTYRVIGAFAAAWHARCSSDGRHRRAVSRFEAPVIPPEIRARALAATGASQQLFLHGDLNASNIILTPAPRAVDFDEIGFGPPELDLAIALGYVNTSPEDLGGCFHALLRGYREAGGVADAGSVKSLAEIIPWYMAASHQERLGEQPLPPGGLEAAAAQAEMIAAALAGF